MRFPSPVPSEYLVIGFQSIQLKPSYNYIKSLNGLPVHRLYIKDGYGGDELTHSSYYLNENNPIAVDDLVQALISRYCDELDITKSNTIFIGSSKGGYASLYHGYKFGAGHIIAGGPQVLLGDYLFGRNEDKVGPPIFKFLFGELNLTNKEHANSLLFNVIDLAKAPYPNTYIHVGIDEPHYIGHVKPFINKVNELNIPNVVLDLGEYDTHKEMPPFYRAFLKKQVSMIINS